MTHFKLLSLLCLLSFSLVPSAHADDGDNTVNATASFVASCSQPCPGGQVLVSYLDGQQVDCACMPQGPGMTDDTNVNYGGPEASQ